MPVLCYLLVIALAQDPGPAGVPDAPASPPRSGPASPKAKANSKSKAKPKAKAKASPRGVKSSASTRSQPDAGAEAEPLPPYNLLLLEYARGHLGEQVGNGECTSLVTEAYRRFGIRRLPPHGADADYVWGSPVEEFVDARPGDVLQFRDAVLKGSARSIRGGQLTIRSWTRTFDHHTAVVEEVRDRGRTLVILHQNTGTDAMTEAERRRVQRDTLRLDELQPGGWIKAYRPVPAD